MRSLQWRKSNIRFSNLIAIERMCWLGWSEDSPNKEGCFDFVVRPTGVRALEV